METKEKLWATTWLENQPEKTGGTGEDEGHFPALLVAEINHAPGDK